MFYAERPQLKDNRLKRLVRSGMSSCEEDLRGLEEVRGDLLEARRFRVIFESDPRVVLQASVSLSTR